MDVGGDNINFVEAMIYVDICISVLLAITFLSFLLGSFIADGFNLTGMVWWTFVIIFVLVIYKILN
ncbi:hypothetical protein [Methanosphaera sp. BMS]|uniref:hypothetical protein n=1 Tax=Methanosphaera sp. BMS TaxID=1789762 RepID=UPI000DC1DBF5|nr:hypothetical protein [Methanosphaera sp. BMS]AWX33223.1 hypothetical protein AW729_09045 [Methanosphaera sp. BMS]